jgi:hypothetical protein
VRPRDEYEAYLAGLVAADGTVNARWGYTILAQKEAARPVFDALAERFGTRYRVEHRVTNFGASTMLLMNFKDLPTAWKRQVPDLPLDLERHYFRGLVDGDGSLSECLDGSREANLCWAVDQPGFGDAFGMFLDRHRICATFRAARDGVELWRVRRRADAARLAFLLYDGAQIALPWKAEVAQRWALDLRAGVA